MNNKKFAALLFFAGAAIFLTSAFLNMESNPYKEMLAAAFLVVIGIISLRKS